MSDASSSTWFGHRFGKRGGAFATIRADELVAQVMNGLVDRLDVDPSEVEYVHMGCVTGEVE